MRLLGRQSKAQVDEENPYWVSFSDIMAGLLIVFILAAIALVLELSQKKAQWDESLEQIKKAERVREEVIDEIKRELEEKGIYIVVNENKTGFSIDENQLVFDSGDYEIPEAYQEDTLYIGLVVYEALAKDDRLQYLDTIFVEGHTDDVPFKFDPIRGNWRLSSLRAISVWTYWNQTLPDDKKLDNLLNFKNDKLFSVSGYAETRPFKSSDRDDLDIVAQRKQDRRIELRFTAKRPDMTELENLGFGSRD